MAISIACSWNRGTPSVRSKISSSSLRWVFHRFFTVAPAQVGMHHIALYRPGPYDGHLDHQVIKFPWSQPWQHRHLRAAFDLENTQRIGPADHVINFGIVLRDVGQRKILTVMKFRQVECLADAGEHAQRQHIHFQKTERFDIILVPFDIGTVFHPCVQDRAEVGELYPRDHKTARMLAKLARETNILPRKLQDFHQVRVVRD